MKRWAVCRNTSNFVSRNLYGDIQNRHPEKPLSIKLGEIIDQNPNSRELITLVLKDLYQQGGLRSVKSGRMEKYLLAIFLLCQSIFLEHLVDLLGFRTKNSREFIMNCRNQYVTWQVSTYHIKHFSKSFLECVLLKVCEKNTRTTSYQR